MIMLHLPQGVNPSQNKVVVSLVSFPRVSHPRPNLTYIRSPVSHIYMWVQCVYAVNLIVSVLRVRVLSWS